MFGLRIRNVFKSRWHAVIWAVGILLTAYCAVPSPEETQEQKAELDRAQTRANPWVKSQE